MAKILFLAHRVPFPPDKGDKIRAFHELEHLARQHRIWLGAGMDDPADLIHLAPAQRRFEDAYFGLARRTETARHLARAVLTGAPLSVARFRHEGLMRWCEHVLRTVEPDLVFVFSSAAAQFVLGRMCDRTRLMVDFVDADAQKWRAYAQASAAPKRWLYATEFRRLVRYETQVAAAAQAGIFVSRTDRDLFAGFVPLSASRLHVIANGVDTAFFRPDPGLGALRTNSIVFTGRMDYRPNIDAMTWFAHAILPSIRRRVPGAHLRIVGAKPAAAVQALARLEGVEVTGAVPDVRPYLQQAHAVVAPMRIARGIQNKVLEGLAMARPVVTTPQGLDGIAAEPGRDLLVAADAGALAGALCDILQGTAPPTLGANGREAVLHSHGWDHHMGRLDHLIARILHSASGQAAADKG
jgi:sugar transferase (PEP-CTERM/EpsH1 system associated)